MAINIGFDEQRFLKILTDLIGETKYLQNNPPRYVPEEDRSATTNMLLLFSYNKYMISYVYECLTCRAVNHVLKALEPYTRKNGGLLKVQHISYVEGRGNLIVKYKKVSS